MKKRRIMELKPLKGKVHPDVQLSGTAGGGNGELLLLKFKSRNGLKRGRNNQDLFDLRGKSQIR